MIQSSKYQYMYLHFFPCPTHLLARGVNWNCDSKAGKASGAAALCAMEWFVNRWFFVVSTHFRF